MIVHDIKISIEIDGYKYTIKDYNSFWIAVDDLISFFSSLIKKDMKQLTEKEE